MMATKMMETPSQQDYQSAKNNETILERSAVTPIATHIMF